MNDIDKLRNSTLDRLDTVGPPDLSPLATFAVATVPTYHRQIDGLVSVPAGAHPFDESLGESCGDPECRYRSYGLELHDGPYGLFGDYVECASAAGVDVAELLAGLDRDIFRVRSGEAVAIADMSRHPINYRVQLAIGRLRANAADSLDWELIRIVRDGCGTEAVSLPPPRQRDGDLLVHADLACRLEVTRLGHLVEVMPTVTERVVNRSLLVRFMTRVLGMRQSAVMPACALSKPIVEGRLP
jgi:hypothetical protein